MGRLKILSPGFLTTVQDSGRYGYRSYGMPLSGAMDFFSHMTGNLLVGNEPGVPSLEITLTGPEIEFTGRLLIAVTGAEMYPTINGQQVEMWKSHRVGRKDRLSFSYPASGARAYLSVAGGLRVPVVMGSASTYLRGKTGGLNGRKCEEGDIVETGSHYNAFRKPVALPLHLIPEWKQCQVLSVVSGIDCEAFPEESIGLFYRETFSVSNYSDRMGIRLSGHTISHRDKADVISYPIVPGTIQVPGDGNPVMMLADSQTVGGYTQIAVLATSSLWKTGQLKPGDMVNFRLIENGEAVRQLVKVMNELDEVFGRGDNRITMERYRNKGG
ncbi:MAG: biotin-dependent carboxyltransferase family protein [Bacteroidetes bacterium]|nr:biotin-dependent carboxyltransferase family protein [Bacteroidota bacterium]